MSRSTRNQAIIDLRKSQNIEEKIKNSRKNLKEFVTYDGPPFATGVPHIGHGLVSIIKDSVIRFKTMTAYSVPRRRGRDCHGLPAEKFAEKQLGIDGKKDIEKVWIEKFVESCRSVVSKEIPARKNFMEKIGRRVDRDTGTYFTMDLDFMESEMRLFARLYHQNLIYQWFSIQGYCPSCATPLSNAEISEGYQDRQDPAATVAFPSQDADSTTVRAIFQNEFGEILLQQHILGHFSLPGGRVEKDETPESALAREIHDELGLTIESQEFIGDTMEIFNGKIKKNIFFRVTTRSGDLKNHRPENFAKLRRAKISDAQNNLGFSVQIDKTTIDDDSELHKNFWLLNARKLAEKIGRTQQQKIHFLARTTTPRTLPSNQLLAVGPDIDYALIFDPQHHKFFLLGDDALPQIFKNRDDQKIIPLQILSGVELAWLGYDQLRTDRSPTATQNLENSKKNLDPIFQITTADFVETGAGTSIVHIAPAFGADDFGLAAERWTGEILAKNLLMPLDEFGEFTDKIPTLAGSKFLDANKKILENLKSRELLLRHDSLNHSYPHCRRCKNPLLYRAITSRFVKEKSLAPQTVAAADRLTVIPPSVKKRFTDILGNAPDRNISRNRFRGAPIPVRISERDPDDHIVPANLDELFTLTQSGSQNLTRHILVRHGQGTHNLESRYNSRGDAELTELGQQQARDLTPKLQKFFREKNRKLSISPCLRTRQTIEPTLHTVFGDSQTDQLKKSYDQNRTLFLAKRDSGDLKNYLHDPETQKLFRLSDDIFVDRRTTELFLPEREWLLNAGETAIRYDDLDRQFTPNSETRADLAARLQKFRTETNQTFKNHTLITVAHEFPILTLQRLFKKFDFATQRAKFSPKNAEICKIYRDHARDGELDLHKPAIDSYRFQRDGAKFTRVPEVLDCRFDSGSMPVGQAHFLGETTFPQKNLDENAEKKSETNSEKNSEMFSDEIPSTDGENSRPKPAEFIVEWLDQTRGRFRSLHVLANAAFDQNAFSTVAINGLLLGSDGKKLSKSLGNFRDPLETVDQFGADAVRLALLSSPAVRGEPVKVSDELFDQALKDFLIPLENIANFFRSYAQIDDFSLPTTRIFHAPSARSLAVHQVIRCEITQIITEPDSTTLAQNLAQKIHSQIGTKISVLVESDAKKILPLLDGERTLVLGHETRAATHRAATVGSPRKNSDTISSLPTRKITNELDHRVLAALHADLRDFQKNQKEFQLDAAAKILPKIADNISGRFIRRSRKRFRADNPDGQLSPDKMSAFSTLATALEILLRAAAPLTPFLTEELRQKIRPRLGVKSDKISIHEFFLPLPDENLIDPQRIAEIAAVRRIISSGLAIRARQNIKTKQPLRSAKIFSS